MDSFQDLHEGKSTKYENQRRRVLRHNETPEARVSHLQEQIETISFEEGSV